MKLINVELINNFFLNHLYVFLFPFSLCNTHTRARAHTHTHTHIYIYIYIYIYGRDNVEEKKQRKETCLDTFLTNFFFLNTDLCKWNNIYTHQAKHSMTFPIFHNLILFPVAFLEDIIPYDDKTLLNMKRRIRGSTLLNGNKINGVNLLL